MLLNLLSMRWTDFAKQLLLFLSIAGVHVLTHWWSKFGQIYE
jgi:hypothetical protein